MIEAPVMWETYETLGKMVARGELKKEDFEKQIRAFSYFLSDKNQDYYYNRTYLPNYVEEFWSFLKAFGQKYSFVTALFQIAQKYPDVTLRIDHYWQMKTFWVEETKKIKIRQEVCPSYSQDLKNDNTWLIECSILCNAERFLYQKRAKKDDLDMQKTELTDFLNKHSKERDKIEKNG